MNVQAGKLDGPADTNSPSESQNSQSTNVSSDSLPLEYQSVFAPTPGKPRRMHYGDAVRILGTVAVVIGHVADMRFGGHALDRDWWISNIWEGIARWAVPAYIMLSGALLLDPAREEPPGEFYRKRLARIGVPLVFWTAFFMAFRLWVLVPKGWGTPRQVWLDLAMGKPYMHLHFIFRIAGLYFFTPMMRVWLRHTTRGMQIGAIVTALALSSADSIMNGITGNEPSVFARFVPFVGYYLLGYLLRDTRVSKAGLRWCWAGCFAMAAILVLGTGLLVKLTGGAVKWYPSINMMLYDFLSPVRIIMAVCVWLIFVNTFTEPWPNSKARRDAVQRWAATTLGLYLVHPFFRELLYFTKMWDAGKGVWWPNVWLGIPLASLAVYVLALVTTAVLMKIPYVRRITG
jgi:surface polysaccharide O-acyltransferase-like enzyme